MKKITKHLKLLILSLLGLVLVACVNDVTEMEPGGEEETTAEAPVEEPQYDEDEVVATVVIRNVGDILIHDTVWEDARTAEGFDFKPMLAPVKQYMENADITVANLEMPVAGGDYGYSTYPAFNSPHEIVEALQDAGVDIVNNATNHSLDQGSWGAVQSAANIESYGMEYVGSFQSWEDYNELRILEANGVKVGFLGYTDNANGLYPTEGMEYTAAFIDPAVYPLEIEMMTENADITIAMFHMGEEYSDMPNKRQLEVMQVAREAGANYIMGGHPHVVQPFIQYNASQGAWFSHGNFLSGQYPEETKIGGIGEVTFNQMGDGDIEIAGYRFMPTYNVGLPETSYYLVVPLADAADYGFYNGDAWFELFDWQMNYFADVEVVEYLD